MSTISKTKTITPPQTLINQRVVKTSFTAAKAAAAVDLSGAAMIADSLSSMSDYLKTSSSSSTSTVDSVDLFGTASTDLFGSGVGSTVDLFV